MDIVSKKAEEDPTETSMKIVTRSVVFARFHVSTGYDDFNSIQTRSRVEKAWMSCKGVATDRTFILPFAIVCTLFTFQALSG